MPSSHRRHEERQRRARTGTTTRTLVTLVAIGGALVLDARSSAALAPATCASTRPLACGEVKTGTIAALDETDCYEFSGDAGEVVQLLAKAVGSSIEACLQLRDPNGDAVGADACGEPATLTLPATGTYTVRLFDRSHDETGGYAVQLQVLSASGSSCPTATLPCGANRAGFLASTVQSDTYRVVAGESGEVVSITTADTSSPFEACWQLYGADGSAVGTPACGHDIRTLPVAGPYTIRVFDLANDDTGTYRIGVTVVSATAGSCPDATLVCGGTHPDTIAAIGENDVYWFTTTTPNEVVTIATATTGGSLNTCWELYEANGASTGGIVCGQEKRVLETPETYVLRVFDLGYENAGEYEVAAQASPACPATPTPTATPAPTPTDVGSGGPTPDGGGGTATPDGSSTAGATPPGGGTATPGGGGATPSATSSGSATVGVETPTPQGTPSVQALEAVLDDFLCYAATRTRGSPKFTPARGLRMSDTVDDTPFDVTKAIALCAPADKDGNGITDAATSLERYRIRRDRHAPRFVRTTRRVATALGTLSLDTVRPDQLLVPTAASAVAPPAAPDPSAHDLDDYKCYRVRVTRNTPKLPVDLQVRLTEALSSPGRRFTVKSPTRLCVAAGEDLGRLHDSAGHLLCYAAKLVRGEPKHVKQRGLYLGNALGGTRVDTVKESELCLPAVVVP